MNRISVSTVRGGLNVRWRSKGLVRAIASLVNSSSVFGEKPQPFDTVVPSPHSGDLESLASPLERNAYHAAHSSFLQSFPEYKLTVAVDTLRATDYTRLDKGEVYVDYMGGSLYPETLIRHHSAFLQQNVLGNTHSVSNRQALISHSCFMIILLMTLGVAPVCLPAMLAKRERQFYLSLEHLHRNTR
jgi:hypothetical protein